MHIRTLILCLGLVLLIGDILEAQKPERPIPFRPDTATQQKPYLPPVPFPAQNLHPNPDIINEQGVVHPGLHGGEVLMDTTRIVPQHQIIKGDPGAFGRVHAFQGDLSTRGFTPMALVSDPTAYPASTAVRLYISGPSWGGQCSGILIDARHVLTAGHCVYDTDLDEWADEIEVAPAYDDNPNEFFGTATSYNMLSWTGWTQNALWEHDMAVIEFARPVGALAGWCGYGYNNSNAYFTGQTFHNYSYPGEPPYNGENMYYRHGNFDSATPNILNHNNYSWGGQSGSGAPDEDQIAYSALSHGNATTTGHTRMTSDKFTSIQEFIGDNTPDETDFYAMRADASHDFIAAGEWLDAIYFFLYNNSAQGYTGNIVIDYYLSEDNYIGTAEDILIGTWSVWLDDLEAKGGEWITFDYPTQIPAGTAPGSYFIGAHVTTPDFYWLNNYTDYQDAFPITVLCGTPEPPLLNVAGSLIKCEDAVVSLAPSNICTDCEVWWSTGDVGPSLSVTEGGAYYAYFLNSCGNFGEISDIILIENIPNPETPEIEIDGSTLLCDGDYVTLHVTNPCPDCWVEWSNGQSGESLVVTEDGIYTAYMENICGQSPDSDPVYVETEESPAAPGIVANGPTMLCPGENVTLTATGICSGCFVEWSTGQSGSSITVSAAGNYSATLINDCGESPSSNGVSVTQITVPASPSILASGTTQLCTGQSVTLMADQICAGCSVEWSTGEAGNSIIVSTAGSYTAVLTNDCGTSPISNSISVTLTDTPTAPAISAPSNSLCEGQSMTLTATNICSGCTILWSTGQTGNSIIVSAPGTYSASASNSCGNSPVSNVITVSLEPGFLPIVQVNNTCHLAAPNGNNFQWRLNGVDIANATSQFWTALEDGYYTVRMTNPVGCEGMSDPVFAEACATSTAHIFPASHVRLYPNPTTDRIYLEWRSGTPLTGVHIDLFASDGQQLPSGWTGDSIAGNSTIEIPLLSVAPGMYLLRLTSHEGQIHGRVMIMN